MYCFGLIELGGMYSLFKRGNFGIEPLLNDFKDILANEHSSSMLYTQIAGISIVDAPYDIFFIYNLQDGGATSSWCSQHPVPYDFIVD